MLSKMIDENTQEWCYQWKNEDTGQLAWFSEDFLIKIMQHPKFQIMQELYLKEKPYALD